LPITPLYKDVIQMFAQSGIAETPTLIVNYGGHSAKTIGISTLKFMTTLS